MSNMRKNAQRVVRRWRLCGFRHFSVDRRSQKSKDSMKELIQSLPVSYLRALDLNLFDSSTMQRKDVEHDPHSGKILRGYRATAADMQCLITEIHENGEYVRVSWSNGNKSVYSMSQLQGEMTAWNGGTPRTTWTGLTETSVRESNELSMPFRSIITTQGSERALRTIFQYGILLVTDTPVDDGGYGVAAVGAALGGGDHKNQASLLAHYDRKKPKLVLSHGTDGPMRTLYGTVWSTTSAGQADGASVADSAYGREGLPLHTDMTYLRDPPGLQIFTMIQPATRGGESVFADGFAVAELLAQESPEVFYTLSRVQRRYRCIDNSTGWHLEARGPVLDVSKSPSGDIVSMVRHNDLDRLPDFPPSNASSAEESAAFYEKLESAHAVWDEILGRDSVRLVMSLRPGDSVVVANQRCFHGRYGFRTSPGASRSVMGCYVSQDELESRFRRLGLIS